jgi:hypothetical protein
VAFCKLFCADFFAHFFVIVVRTKGILRLLKINFSFSHGSSNELAPMGIYKNRHEITKRENNQAAAYRAAQ